MSSWVLILMWAGYQWGGYAVTQEFSSKEKCEAAAKQILIHYRQNAICVEK